MLPLLRDPNDEVKVQVCEVLSKWGGATDPVTDCLCQALAEDDSAWVQASAALSRIGHAAASAGPALLRAARTGKVGVREQAMRALVMIQPPEAAEGFTAGLADPTAEVRLVASAGWPMKAASVPETAGPVLVDALRDPESQVRANAAHALARLDELPTGAVSALRECAGDPNDARLNAALALRLASPGEVADLMDHLLDDPNVWVRMVAAGGVLGTNPADARAASAVVAAADDPNPRVRQAVEELLPLVPRDRLAEEAVPMDLAPDDRPVIVRCAVRTGLEAAPQECERAGEIPPARVVSSDRRLREAPSLLRP